MARKANKIQGLRERLLCSGLHLFDWLALAVAKRSAPREEPWILVVKVDLLGDYILVRNFFEIIKKSPTYRGYKLAFCCNQALVSLSQRLDADVVDEWLALKPKPFIKNLGYRWRFIKKVRSREYAIALFPTHSRAYLYDDTLAKWVRASRKIAPIDNGHNHLAWQHKKASAFYHQLIANELGLAFEFYLNRAFFEEFIGMKLEISAPTIRPTTADRQALVVLSPGASKLFRQWPARHFVSLGRELLAAFPSLRIAITGSASETALCALIAQGLDDPQRVANHSGTMTLSDLVALLSNAKMLIANESGVVHLAQALHLPAVLCVSNGNHLGRFSPYPPSSTPVQMRYCYPPSIGKQEDINNQLVEMYYWGSLLPIDQVELAQVRQSLGPLAQGLFGNRR